ncbi:NAD-dependent epimerase/dehydratase [Flavobacterium enshiense DK69]|uniref:Epimerase n=1 Tax=Flavobacterium enshiense DK69 TaxID=1107311 RepID=V6SCV5_9FLAO|nr:NAD(P)-binding domain-containing protein [Flavobacterium enshiense]ESU24289.1 NAD-dependent epimerase/dehydratase [Flavobacterium enshiense DK69]KGO95338.1 epimerase [Flavobacterium enshiense DK69]
MKTNKPKIAVLGCGWLGFPLAKKLFSEGFPVNGSTTSEKKITLLKENGIIPFQIILTENETQGAVYAFLEDSEILIIDIPPGLRHATTEGSVKIFVSKIERMLPYIEKSSVQKVIFISSTSVYPDTNKTITEETVPDPDSESGKQLVAVEKILQQNPSFKTTVIRFGGLIGSDRHPIKMLAGKQDLSNPGAVINLIHQEDCIGIIMKIIEEDVWDETFNAVTPFHPTRQEYYSKKANEMKLLIPTFVNDKPSIGKYISSEKIEKVLKYSFRKNNL